MVIPEKLNIYSLMHCKNFRNQLIFFLFCLIHTFVHSNRNLIAVVKHNEFQYDWLNIYLDIYPLIAMTFY